MISCLLQACALNWENVDDDELHVPALDDYIHYYQLVSNLKKFQHYAGGWGLMASRIPFEEISVDDHFEDHYCHLVSNLKQFQHYVGGLGPTILLILFEEIGVDDHFEDHCCQLVSSLKFQH
ncbi:unnamed protein product [Linum trigynum]|uniref:Uncharacterized protein n=1 Tax=Linum trigynum TaxID=586398 RepID=A0AAV2FR92_9ROSI